MKLYETIKPTSILSLFELDGVWMSYDIGFKIQILVIQSYWFIQSNFGFNKNLYHYRTVSVAKNITDQSDDTKQNDLFIEGYSVLLHVRNISCLHNCSDLVIVPTLPKKFIFWILFP